jgi:thiomorpholine-carboxylate dehydrogenase
MPAVYGDVFGAKLVTLFPLNASSATVLALLGSGVQARAHFRALGLVRHFSEVWIWSRTTANAQALAKEIGGIATTAEDAVRRADVVVTVTHASEPILQGRWLKPGALICAVGAVGTTNRELDNAAMQGSVIVDSRDAAMLESGDILLAGATVYAELGEILSGKTPLPSADTTVFKSLGLAVEDLAAAKLVLEFRKP